MGRPASDPSGSTMRYILLIVLALAAAAPAGADDTRPALAFPDRPGRQPLDTETWPWIAIGRVNREIGGHCTGTLVRPDTVLTASHCLRGPGGKLIQPTSVHFVAGWRRGGFVAHGRGHAFEQPESGALSDDWALIRLDTALDVRPLRLLRTAPGIGTAIVRAGYGRDRPHLLTRDLDCRVRGEARGMLLHDCDSLPGDSGAPLLVETDEGWVVGAIAIGIAGNDPVVGLAVSVAAAADTLVAEGL
ncbi:trypsin-like serine peptidase [Marinivivus vitaminiproducens]|uniref:trypsin-like serine peptidase n=1 Tax=Marinivivus vitaminiproducens TaxID=3035935 RepID=UPI0027A4EA32|nr:trypsin-like serine protease [Geminicoccaceae bacterium SCSIO 64248]